MSKLFFSGDGGGWRGSLRAACPGITMKLIDGDEVDDDTEREGYCSRMTIMRQTNSSWRMRKMMKVMKTDDEETV